METYGFNSGSDNGVACVYGNGTGKMVMYIEKMLPSGERNIAVAATQFDEKEGKHVGNLYRLYPTGPKREFVASSAPGFLKMKFSDGESIEMHLKPNGLAWVPADIRQINGCAMETPQIFLNVMDQGTMQHNKMMLCAMGHKPGSGYEALYGFGLRNGPAVGTEPFIFLGQTITPIVPSGPVNIVANTMDVCLRPDCKMCSIGYKSFTLTN